MFGCTLSGLRSLGAVGTGSIHGYKRDIESCHTVIRTKIISDSNGIIRRDELGDEIRAEAYRHLSDIEVGLRYAIERIFTETVGEEWWDEEHVDPTIKLKGEQRSKGGSTIEGIDRRDTFKLLTAKYRFWQEDAPITPAQLLEAISKSENLHELSEYLKDRLRKRDIWDEILSLYFTEPVYFNAWKKFLEEADFLETFRNKVMHHHYVMSIELDRLKEIRVLAETAVMGVDHGIDQNQREQIKAVMAEYVHFVDANFAMEIAGLRNSLVTAIQGPQAINFHSNILKSIQGSYGVTAIQGLQNIGINTPSFLQSVIDSNWAATKSILSNLKGPASFAKHQIKDHLGRRGSLGGRIPEEK